MRSYVWPIGVILLLAFGTATFAGDTVFMPTGNQVAKGKFEYNFIFVDLDIPGGPVNNHSVSSAAPRNVVHRAPPEWAMIHEFFLGVTDRLEIDVDVLDADVPGEDVEINPYFTFIKETDDHPSFIGGVYNLFRQDFGGDKRMSPFFVSSYNIFKPEGPPKCSDPLIRGHFGWGTGQHDSDFLGGVQFVIDPKIGGAVYTHHGDMAYIGVYKPHDWLELRGGTLGGDEWGSFGLYVDL